MTAMKLIGIASQKGYRSSTKIGSTSLTRVPVAPCPAGGLGCWGCRGPAEAPNYGDFFALAAERGFDEQQIHDRLSFFGGFDDVLSMTVSEESTNEDQP